MRILILNGTIVNSKESILADVLISDGVIERIGKNLQTEHQIDRIIDAGGFYIFPGGIDPHVHLQLPTTTGISSDSFLTGTKAAIYGGTTSIIDFVTPSRGQSMTDALQIRKNQAIFSLINYSFHVSPVEWNQSVEDEILEIIKKEGINSFKVYMAYKNSIGLDNEDILKVMNVVGKAGGLVTVHCELGDEIEKLRNEYANTNLSVGEAHLISRPEEMEYMAVKKAIGMAQQADCPLYIVHVSSMKSLEYISEAQKNGQVVFAETCPQYLLLDQSEYSGEFNKVSAFIMSPPLRTKMDNEALWKGISNDTVQTIGTDHCPFMLFQKQFGINDFRKIPNGAGGIEHRMSLLYTYGVLQDKFSLNRFVEITSTNAAKIFGLYPQKGVIKEGSDADLVIWNPNTEETISIDHHHQNSDLNIYEGIEIKGSPEYVILNGEIVLNNGKLVSNLSSGEFLKRNRSNLI